MTTCAGCGHQQGDGRFCAGCGVPVAADAPTTVQPVVPLLAEPAAAAPSSRGEVPRWLPWALGWLLLAVVAATVGWSIGSSGRDATPARAVGADAPATPDAPAAEPPDPAPAPDSGPAGGPADVTAASTAVVPETAPPNRSVAGAEVTYDAAHLLDGDPETAWRMPGDGTGAVLTFTLPGPTRLSSVGLVNGYAKVDGQVDWYPRNRRVTAVTWGFDDGTTLTQDLIENPSLQTVGVEGVTTSSVTLTLTAVSAPGAEGGRDFTPVSDVRLIGSPG